MGTFKRSTRFLTAGPVAYSPARKYIVVYLNRRVPMQMYFGALTIVLLLGMVWGRVLLMRMKGINVVHFGRIDKKDFLIPPFAVFYFYIVFAAAFKLPSLSRQEFFHSETVTWIGALLCLAGLPIVFLSLFSFGKSFRVGIDLYRPGKLVTTGIYAFSRNPIYTALLIVSLGQFLIFSNWILLVYMFGAIWLIHRQVLREENFLRDHYGEQYSEYCSRVRRYL
jgi:protein-S-isoprenylcysteine O-methyltransferase Ste14